MDRAALDWALAAGIPCGGWCPRGRKAEDGRISAGYPLQETESSRYDQRTEWNVRDADGTLVLTAGRPTGGTALTVGMARKWRKPCLVVDLSGPAAVDPLIRWCQEHTIRVLNVAGPRESTAPGIYQRALTFLEAAGCAVERSTKA